MSRPDPLSVWCPTCRMRPGKSCRTLTHRPWATTPHVARVRAAAVLVGCLPPTGG